MAIHIRRVEFLSAVFSLGLVDAMKEITASEFRANCYSILKAVRTTGISIRVVRSGKPLAEIVPVSVIAAPVRKKPGKRR